MDMTSFLIGRANAGGGGDSGSSDFSTAEVTLVGYDVAGDVYLSVTNAGPPDVSFVQASYTFARAQNFVAILYKGAAVGMLANAARDEIEHISGNAEDVGNGYFMVTGDCTITIKQK